jgi:hypothetical protein
MNEEINYYPGTYQTEQEKYEITPDGKLNCPIFKNQIDLKRVIPIRRDVQVDNDFNDAINRHDRKDLDDLIKKFPPGIATAGKKLVLIFKEESERETGKTGHITPTIREIL